MTIDFVNGFLVGFCTAIVFALLGFFGVTIWREILLHRRRKVHDVDSTSLMTELRRQRKQKRGDYDG